jgi:hypothetical protein
LDSALERGNDVGKCDSSKAETRTAQERTDLARDSGGDNFGACPAIGKEDDNVVVTQRAKVAMGPLGRVNCLRRHAWGASEREREGRSKKKLEAVW